MEPREYAEHDGLGLAERIRQGEVAPEEPARAALEAIARLNPALNAVVAVRDDWAEDLAHSPKDSPFYGVPFLLKDHVVMQKGQPLEFGSRLLHGAFVAPADSDLGARYRRAGLVTLGRTNTAEMAYSPTTESVLYGPAHNPWQLERSPGGSSGGAAAAVAAGLVPAAHATDGGGSIRTPAAYCGLYGLKPTRMRNPPGPTFGEAFYGLGVEHVISRTVRDSAALLDATNGPGVGDKYQIPRPARSYLETLTKPLPSLRVAFSTLAYNGTPVDANTIAAVTDTAALLERLGHRVEEAAPTFSADAFDQANLVMWSSFLATAVQNFGAMTGREPSPEYLEATLWATAQYGLTLRASDLDAATETQNQVTRAVGAFYERYDLLLTPTTPTPALPLGMINANDSTLDARGWYDHAFAPQYPFTMTANFTGLPAASVPLYQSGGSLPIGVHFMARFGEEDVLLQLSAQLEASNPWINRRPPIYVG